MSLQISGAHCTASGMLGANHEIFRSTNSSPKSDQQKQKKKKKKKLLQILKKIC